MKIIQYFLLIGLMGVLLAALGLTHSGEVLAGERYADVEVLPDGWRMREMQTFSGTTPSRAWVFGRGQMEVVVSVIITEGISGGLEGQAAENLAKIYVDSLIAGWGGRADSGKAEVGASFCGGYPGYRTKGTFGGVTQEFYGCFWLREDLHRAVSVVTWAVSEESEASVSGRLHEVVRGIRMSGVNF